MNPIFGHVLSVLVLVNVITGCGTQPESQRQQVQSDDAELSAGASVDYNHSNLELSGSAPNRLVKFAYTRKNSDSSCVNWSMLLTTSSPALSVAKLNWEPKTDSLAISKNSKSIYLTTRTTSARDSLEVIIPDGTAMSISGVATACDGSATVRFGKTLKVGNAGTVEVSKYKADFQFDLKIKSSK